MRYATGSPTDDASCSRNGGSGDEPQWQGFVTVDGIRDTVFDISQPDKAGVIIGQYIATLYN